MKQFKFFNVLTIFALSSSALLGYSAIPSSSMNSNNNYVDVNTDNGVSNKNCSVIISTEDTKESNIRIVTTTTAEGALVLQASGPLRINGTLRLDDDGWGYSHLDPTHNNETSFKRNGTSLNADFDCYIVVPNYLLKQGVKLGSRADATMTFVDSVTGVLLPSTTVTVPAIVGDVGSDDKGVGEVSIKVAEELGFGIRDVLGVGPVLTLRGSNVNYNVLVTITYYL